MIDDDAVVGRIKQIQTRYQEPPNWWYQRMWLCGKDSFFFLPLGGLAVSISAVSIGLDLQR